MDHFPIFVRTRGKSVLLAGGGEAAIAKLRLLLKTEAQITVAAEDPAPEIVAWEAEGRLRLIRRRVEPGDAKGCVLAYGAHEAEEQDERALQIMSADGALVNIVDDLARSQFITPAMVDRSPVVVAIGTEGAAPVLARRIKAELEERLSPTLGLLTRTARSFRGRAEALRMGEPRRRFWGEWFESAGPRAADTGADLDDTLASLLDRHLNEGPRKGRVEIVGAGPGDAELLTLKARAALDRADVVIHDASVSPEILELARREAILIAVAEAADGPTISRDDASALMIREARQGALVVRLQTGDPASSGGLDGDTAALTAAGIAFGVIPGIASAGPQRQPAALEEA
ncbi:uroporphyrinogen-III C-methyltransferase [Paracoccus sp. Z118]|uniref:SAM-dependent methyltransferase n=1 Tax=Paracoccus sp. Z118 TaxID=2851017 RepID=UPI001C2C9D08|nr:SAM-dependent methyltransferase [Paracoccus sp. Z118]MBV0891453.1 uroporphyrinogen-III C-methyltransferase [Paracoccus sp. Z118]